MGSRATTLLRGPEDPGRATFLELFFDLVFVFAFFRLSQGLLDRLTWSGAFQTVVLLLAVWWVWGNTAGLGNRFDPAQPVIQALVIGCMFGSFLLAVVAPEALGPRGLVFAGAVCRTAADQDVLRPCAGGYGGGEGFGESMLAAPLPEAARPARSRTAAGRPQHSELLGQRPFIHRPHTMSQSLPQCLDCSWRVLT